MKKILLPLSFFICACADSQEFIDTSFSVRGHTCQCRYNINTADDNNIFDRNGQPAYYPGGEDQWKKFVKKNLDQKFKGKDEVQVRFQVEKDGELTGFVLLSRAPNQKYEEVLRVLKLSGKWFPSRENGFCVRSYVRLMFKL